ncbi:MAG TPA: dienelactone hydrolase family protein [Intrasporangium sp.]|uniref:dienelactone hydrolase family protein n=1 Tax=Intrasporangium sp. TaxID=1925024 RepID=UPI002D7762A1|nr:dienelactone hydrolase family protein [Intrasporangium sp.]HET7399781.1 dienelactone hydrolase family protein [Intrasporangium sp.]
MVDEHATESQLRRWSRGTHAAGPTIYPTYRRGAGPGVVVIHESPGLTPEVIAFADEVVAEGFTVVLPHLFGSSHAPPRTWEGAWVIPRLCVSREFTMLATGRTAPLAGWLRSLARELHAELGGPGVGAVGMCVTGGFALAMMVDPSVVAPVVAQPAVPLPIGRRRAADLNLSPDDLAAVRRRVAGGCPVLGLRYRDDWVTGTRFETLRRELGDGFLRVELPGLGHSTLTDHRHPEAVARVLAFFRERLKPGR